jgi:tetratricopeptide (TPR) repeat protein
MSSEEFHYGQVIRFFRLQRGIPVAKLASLWPGGPVDPRYVQRVEAGKKHIKDLDTLRQLGDILDVPLWQFGLSIYDPFHPHALPGRGEYLVTETLDAIEQLLQQTWYLRQVAPITRAEKSAERLHHLFEHFFRSVPLASQLEPRFLRLYADAQCIRAVLHVERRRYAEALDTYASMYDTAKQLGEPATLAHALMNIGVELDRAGRKQEAVEHLEHARDISFRANKAWAALIHSYLSRIYAGSGDSLRFQRASETAQTLAIHLPTYENDEEAVFYNMSGVLAERSYGYLEIGKPEMTLSTRDEIMRQIRLDHNIRLETWIFLDWARAYLMLHEVEEGVKAAQEFLQRSSTLQSDHAFRRVHAYLGDLENAGYIDIPIVRDFREELKNNDSSSSGGTSHET